MTIRFTMRATAGVLGLAILGASALGQVLPSSQPINGKRPIPSPIRPPIGGIRPPLPPITHRPPTGLAPTPSPRIAVPLVGAATTTPLPTHMIHPKSPVVVHRPTTPPPTMPGKATPSVVVRSTSGAPAVTIPPTTSPIIPSSPATAPAPGPSVTAVRVVDPSRVTIINNGTIVASSTTINHTTVVRSTRNITNIDVIDPWLFPGGIIRPGVVIRPVVVLPPWFYPYNPFGVLYPGGVFINGGYPGTSVVGIPVATPVAVPVAVPVPAAAPVEAKRAPLPAMVPAGGAAPNAAPVRENVNAVVVQAFTTRFLRIQNETGEKLKICLQYRAKTDKGEWGWFPADPREQADQAMTYDVDAGKAADLVDGNWRVNARQVRVWAVSETGQKWFDYKGRDLLLVTEKNAQGDPEYLAAEMETFLFSFAR